MKTKFKLFIASLLAVLFANLSFVSAQETNQWSLDPFTKIEVAKTFTVYLSQGDSYSVNIESSNNQADKVKGVVENGVLKFEAERMVDVSKVKIFVTIVELKAVEVSGAATLIGEDLIKGDHLEIEAKGAAEIDLELQYNTIASEVSGAADLKLSGAAGKHIAEVSGAANLQAKNLQTENTIIEASGAATAQVVASVELSQEVSGAASINNSENEVNYNKGGVSITEDGRKTKVKVGELEIEVDDSDGDTQIRLGDSELNVDEDGNVAVNRKTKKSKFDGHWAGFGMGINHFVDANNEFNLPAGYDFLEPDPLLRSVSVNLNLFEKNINLIQNKVGLVTGLGFTWNNYRFSNAQIGTSGDTIVNLWEDSQAEPEKSKLTSFWVTAPLMLELQTNKHSKPNSFHLAGGLQFAYLLGSHSKVIINDEKTKEKGKFNMNPYRFEAIARVGWGKLNLFATYSLDALFKTDIAPEIYPVSIGVTLVDF
ncbi:MAG: DUF2807 domain-containing protein [Bacteroidales bacterium]|nr:DUF2807 domain-containing protein [Bacteroidales bacterium]